MADFQVTQLSPDEEREFQTWLQNTDWFKEFAVHEAAREGSPPDERYRRWLFHNVINDTSYDYRGLWKERDAFGKEGPWRRQEDQRIHGPSRGPSGKWFKGPGHPTRWMEEELRGVPTRDLGG